MFGAEQSKRRQKEACAHRVSVAYWLSVCLSVCVNPFFPCDLTTPSHCSPPATACQGNKWPPIPRETSIIICTQSRREMSGNMHLSSQSMLDGCREADPADLTAADVTFSRLFGFWNAATINSLRLFWAVFKIKSVAGYFDIYERGCTQFDIASCELSPSRRDPLTLKRVAASISPKQSWKIVAMGKLSCFGRNCAPATTPKGNTIY